MKPERRYTHSQKVVLEKRGEGDDETNVIVGHSAVFYDGTKETEYRLWNTIFERIDPKAFDRALKEKQDIRGLFNHDASLILGRTEAGTMKVTKDKIGLRYEIETGDTTVARDVVEHLERGDITGSSFAMIPRTVEWSEEERGGVTVDIRTIKDVDLFDSGPVTFPAYEGADAGLRSAEDLSDVVAEHRAWKDSLKPKDEHTAANAARARILDLSKH